MAFTAKGYATRQRIVAGAATHLRSGDPGEVTLAVARYRAQGMNCPLGALMSQARSTPGAAEVITTLFDRVYAVNVTAPYLRTRAIAPPMIDAGGGSPAQRLSPSVPVVRLALESLRG
ncbi:Rossmann-fold NAD(P)-binding domain-containing protein [Nocardia aurantia]|uniref:Uncharacterized protein n=1 Tax=Nocardia aurantia TaxID=2585199 RepID=A0A7K0DZP9_9NOCA|nr:hypothetical protein [Nocardia aurantia]MQY31283.1 hypothetical protein [Nocardia aurantia]